MPQVVYPSELEIQGPLLISAGALAELDKVLSEELPKLAEAQSQFIAEKVNAKLNSMPTFMLRNEAMVQERKKQYTKDITEALTTQTTLVTLHFSDDSELKAQSFSEAANHERLSERTAVGFEVHARSGKVQAHMECFKRRYGTRLILEVSPSYETGRELFIALRRWVKNIEAPWWQRLWYQVGATGLLFGLATIGIALGALGTTNIIPSSSYYRHQADDLAKTGIKTQEDERKAVQLLLAIEARSAPPSQHPLFTKRLDFALAALVLICLVAAFPPRLVVGLGHGEASLKYWRWWIKFVSVSVPGFVFAAFVLPYLVETIKRLWS